MQSEMGDGAVLRAVSWAIMRLLGYAVLCEVTGALLASTTTLL
jgi:hypothetical protein